MFCSPGSQHAISPLSVFSRENAPKLKNTMKIELIPVFYVKAVEVYRLIFLKYE